MDVFGGGRREFERVIGTQREANHCNAGGSLTSTFVEELYCICNIGLGLVGVKSTTECFGTVNRVCNGTVVKVGGEGDETRCGEPRAERPDCVVQSPPGVENKHSGAFTGRRSGEVAVGLGVWHGHFLCDRQWAVSVPPSW